MDYEGLTANELREKAWELIALANDMDDKAGICRCLGLDHRFDCPENTEVPF
jgi:hypothetical protein